MQSLQNMTIRRKLKLITMMTSMATLVTACAAFFAYDYRAMKLSLAETMTEVADVVSRNTTAALAAERHAQLEGALVLPHDAVSRLGDPRV